jgi:hypothetical protein
MLPGHFGHSAVPLSRNPKEPSDMPTTTRSSVPASLLFLALGLGGVVSVAAGARTAHAADKTYQVTGPILEVTDSVITVEKGKDKWQLARDKDTKVTGDLKVGAKVTIEYKMTATTIEVKGSAKAATPGAAAKPEKK